MGRLHFTIADALGLVMLLSIGLAGLHACSEIWAGGIMHATLLILAWATLQSVRSRGDRRDAWLVCAVFGWGYLAISAGISSPIPASLLTTHGFMTLYPYVADHSTNQKILSQAILGHDLAIVPSPWGEMTAHQARFLLIGHCLVSIVLGLGAARFARAQPDPRGLEHTG